MQMLGIIIRLSVIYTCRTKFPRGKDTRMFVNVTNAVSREDRRVRQEHK